MSSYTICGMGRWWPGNSSSLNITNYDIDLIFLWNHRINFVCIFCTCQIPIDIVCKVWYLSDTGRSFMTHYYLGPFCDRASNFLLHTIAPVSPCCYPDDRTQGSQRSMYSGFPGHREDNNHIFHFGDVIMCGMASQITGVSDCLLRRLFRSKQISKLCVTGLCEGNSPVTGEFPAQKTSNAENVPIWLRHRASTSFFLMIYRWVSMVSARKT